MIDILYEHGPVIALNKPSGLATQAPHGIDSLEDQLRTFLKAREQKSGNIYIGVPHRLDRPVSGVILFARHVRAARRISEQLEGRLVQKTYWACVAGIVQPDAGTWVDHIIKVPNVAQTEVVGADHPDGRQAILHYRTLGQTPHGSRLEITLETGRMHQIRVQAAARGFPVLGDAQYGSAVPFGEQFADERLRAIALHARHIEFRHPMTQEMVSVTAPLPAVWNEFIPDANDSN